MIRDASGFFVVLCLILVCLKLTGQLAWSWWWVLSPLWAPLAVASVVLLVVALVTLFVFDAVDGKR